MFFNMYVTNRFVLAMALGLLLIPLAGLTLLQRARSCARVNVWWYVGATVGGISLLVLYRIAIRIPSTYYNFSGFLPALLVCSAFIFSGRPISDDGRPRWVVVTYLIILGGMACGAVLGQALWIKQNAEEGRATVNNRLALGEAMRESVANGLKSCADMAALSASPNFHVSRSILFFDTSLRKKRDPKSGACDVYFAVATKAADKSPPSIEGYSLTLDRFSLSQLGTATRPLDMRFAQYYKEIN